MHLRNVLAVLAVLSLAGGLAGCSPPTPEQACKAAGDRFNACSEGGAGKWGEKQIAVCTGDFAASATMKDYTSTLKKCSEMKECEIARQCMMTILVAVGEDAAKSKKK